MRVCIMQPTYLAWMGYFAMMDLSDVFVFYEDVQFEKRSWQQRNRIKMPSGEWNWLSVPVTHNRDTAIKDMKINNSTDWKKDHWKTIYYAYHKAPFFNVYQNAIENIFQKNWENLSEMNIYINHILADLIGIKMPAIFKSSDLGGDERRRTDRILYLVKKFGADEYISAPGFRDYLEKDKFKNAGEKLSWCEYHHPVYPQLSGDFIPYLSVIDLLFNTGPEAIKYLRQGEKNALKLEEFGETVNISPGKQIDQIGNSHAVK